MIPDLPPPTVVENQEQLDRLLEVLAREVEIAVDTEADSFFSYREKVCLIQVTAGGEDYLIDPLTDLDMSGLGEICADPGKVKIFHDGEYDVLILGRCFGFQFANLFDTRIAASALGSQTPGLATVLEEHFGVVLDKTMQRSNWGERPLSQRQIDYARLDTHYLHELMHNQVRELEIEGRRMILDGECRRLEALEIFHPKFNPDEWVRLKGARALSPVPRQACRALFILRDELAARGDVPPFRIMNNQALVDAAAVMPTSVQEIADIRGFSWKQARRIGEDMLRAMEESKELGPLKEVPRLPPKDGTGGLDAMAMELHDRLKTWRRKCSDEQAYDASLILNRHALVALVRNRPASIEELKATDGLIEWQVEAFGEGLLGVIETFEEDLRQGRIEPGGRRRGPRGRSRP